MDSIIHIEVKQYLALKFAKEKLGLRLNNKPQQCQKQTTSQRLIR
jgi:hypothetical protein